MRGYRHSGPLEKIDPEPIVALAVSPTPWRLTRLRGEAVSNHYLEPAHMLSPKRSKALLALGWKPPAPGEDLNFYRDWDVQTEKTRRQMARLAMQTLVEIYGLAPTERMGFELWLDDPKMPAKVLARHSRRADH